MGTVRVPPRSSGCREDLRELMFAKHISQCLVPSATGVLFTIISTPDLPHLQQATQHITHRRFVGQPSSEDLLENTIFLLASFHLSPKSGMEPGTDEAG